MTETSARIAMLVLGVGGVGIGLGFFVWYLWALSRLFPQLGLPAWEGWVPFLNQWRLLHRAGLPGWLVLLGLVSFGVVPLVALIVAAHRLNKQAGLSGGMTVLAALLAPLWAMILTQRLAEQGPTLATASERYLPENQPPALNPAWAPQGEHISGPPPPPAWQPPPAPPPPGPLPQPVSTNVPPPPPHPAALSAAPFARPAPARDSHSLPGGYEIDDEDDHTIINAPADEDEGTVVVDRQPRVEWVLEIHGEEYNLAPDTTLGRNPSPVAGSTLLAIEDSTRVLSKSHARLRLDGDTWWIEDLGSTNGTAVFYADGHEQEIEPHTQVEIVEHLQLGTLPARIRRKV